MVALGSSACTHSQRSSGGGDKVDFCAAYRVYDALPEPSPDRSKEVLNYADAVVRVIARVDNALKVDKATLPKAVVTDLGVVQDGMRTFRSAYRAAGADAARQRQAESALVSDQKVDAADRRLTTFYMAHCRAQNRQGNVAGPSS